MQVKVKKWRKKAKKYLVEQIKSITFAIVILKTIFLP